MMLDQFRKKLIEYHHLELLAIDYDMLDILSVPYSSPIVINGKWRVPVTKKLIYDARCNISNQGKSIVNSSILKIKYHCLNTTSIPYSSTIVRRHVGVTVFQIKKDNFMILHQSK